MLRGGDYIKKKFALFLSLLLILTSTSACFFVQRSTSKQLARGTWNEDVYSSEMSELQFTLPEGWVAATDEEIANLMGIAADSFDDKQKWALEAAKLTTVYDMMAQDPVTGNNVIVMFENLSMVIGGAKMSEEDYLEILKKQIENLDTMEYTFSEPYDTTIGGVDYLTVRADEATVGMSQYYMMHKQDKYMVVVVVTDADGSVDKVMSLFE